MTETPSTLLEYRRCYLFWCWRRWWPCLPLRRWGICPLALTRASP
ncbi:MAG TPA: hypothetical protein VEX37_14620 [Thermomicrobiales bacterium]|nr:hypothetical protein [Thermomicrobiales bacterium]